MIQLLFFVVVMESAMVAVLLFKTPLRKLVIMGLDQLKRDRGPLMVKSIGGTILVVLLSSVYTMIKIQKRRINDGGVVNPTDQILLAKYLLEATLLGAVLFLALMVDRLHHYIRELRSIRRKSMEDAKNQEVKIANSEEIKAMEEETGKLRKEIKRLESELKSKTEYIDDAEANVSALRKQADGFLHEYGSLFEENQELRSQLQSLNGRFTRSGSKNDT